MTKFFSRSLIPTVALAGLAGAFLTAAEPAEARQRSCHAKYQGCSQRCAAAAGGQGDWIPCIQRTCERQYQNCAGAGGRERRPGRLGFVANPQQPGPVASGPQSPRNPVNQGPFPPGGVQPKNGGIVPGGMPKSGGIVSGGMPKNGGIVPSGPVRMFSQGRR